MDAMEIKRIGSWPSRLGEALGARLRTAFARSAAARELTAMSDCELADMGIDRIERHDMNRFFDPKFAREYQSRRGSGRRA
ncbi:MAG: hypothetical protein WBQ75_21625 [Acetobacteraceae bacterium]